MNRQNINLLRLLGFQGLRNRIAWQLRDDIKITRAHARAIFICVLSISNVRSLCSRGGEIQGPLSRGGDEEVPRMALRVLRPKSPHSEE